MIRKNADISFHPHLATLMKQITQEKLFTRKKLHDYSLFPLSDHNPERQHCQGQVSVADGGATLDSAAVLGKIANNGKRHILSKLIFDNLL